MVIGWNTPKHNIVPPLAVFFALLKRPRDEFAPYNLFLRGRQGTNKSAGILHLSRQLGYATESIDVSTLDDVSELAGIMNVRANREQGVFEMIQGDLLTAEVLILDELPNIAPHVIKQFRSLLQGKLKLCGKEVPISVKAFIATGNLGDDMQRGEALALDSPTADRFAMVVQVPRLSEMQADERSAIMERKQHGRFMDEFLTAVKDIDRYFDEVERTCGTLATQYVDSLLLSVESKVHAFEGRRSQLLRDFVLAAMALFRAQEDRCLEEVLWSVVESCLSYHQLSDLPGDNGLNGMHKTAFALISNQEISVDAMIANEQELAHKVSLMVNNLAKLDPTTIAHVCGKVFESPDIALRLAGLELAKSPRFAGAPAEGKALLERMSFADSSRAVSATDLFKISTKMNQTEVIAYQLCDGNDQRTQAMVSEVRRHLEAWDIEWTSPKNVLPPMPPAAIAISPPMVEENTKAEVVNCAVCRNKP